MKYNILTEKWIPMSDGQKYALIECLEHAHELERISCSSPLETYALHRFLCAFVMDALQLPNKAARMALLNQGRFDMTLFDAYIKKCEAEGVSFNLFDEKRPFMQAGYNEKYDTANKPVAAIISEVPYGNNHVFLEHKLENEHTLAFDEAFRKMLTLFTFCPPGGAGYSTSVNGTPCLYVTINGTSLYDTLLLNIVAIKECGNLQYGVPSWRDMSVRYPKEEAASIELLQGLTWQPRRINLICTPNRRIERIFFTPGRNPPQTPLWRDPHVPYSLRNEVFKPITPQTGRSLWQDLGGLAVSKENRYGRQPQVIAAMPSDRHMCRVSVTGLVTVKGKATRVDTICEEMLIPSNILNDEERGDVLHRDMDFIESIYHQIGTALGKKTSKAVVEDMQNHFLASARDYLFATYFSALSKCEMDDDFMALQTDVENNMLRFINSIFDRLTLRLGHDADNIILQSTIRQNILKEYYRLRRERSNE